MPGSPSCSPAVGFYGVVAYVVSQRTREIGVRMALGARRGAVVRLMIWQGLRPAALGMAVGVVAALALSRTLQECSTKCSRTIR